MNENDKILHEDSLFYEECENQRDEESAYFAGFENERRRKDGKPIKTFYKRPEISLNRQDRLKLLEAAKRKTEQIMIARHMKITTRIGNDEHE